MQPWSPSPSGDWARSRPLLRLCNASTDRQRTSFCEPLGRSATLCTVCKFSILRPARSICFTLSATKSFSLPQLLQGENTPSQIKALEQYGAEKGKRFLRLLLMRQVGVLCGIQGERNQIGSRFMNGVNSVNVLGAIACLRVLPGKVLE